MRSATLASAADLLRSRREAVAADVVSENGKTRAEALVEVDTSADFLDFYAGVARAAEQGDVLDAVVGVQRGAGARRVGGRGLALTPLRTVASDLESGVLVRVLPGCEGPARSLYAVHSPGTHTLRKVRLRRIARPSRLGRGPSLRSRQPRSGR